MRAFKYNEDKESFDSKPSNNDHSKSLNIVPGLPYNLMQAASSLKQQAILSSSLKAPKVENSPRVRFADLDDEVQ